MRSKKVAAVSLAVMTVCMAMAGNKTFGADMEDAKLPITEENREFSEKMGSVQKATLSDAALSDAAVAAAVFQNTPETIWSGYLDGSVDGFLGEGTKEEPYLLETAEELRYLAYQVANEDVDGYRGCYFSLVKDINLKGGNSWLPIGYLRDGQGEDFYPFCGHLNGNGFRITNLAVSDSTQDCAGLFGYTKDAVIENLTVTGMVGARNQVGLIAGQAWDTEFYNCSSGGQARGAGVVGGICGEAYGSTFYQCRNQALVLGGDTKMGLRPIAGGICGAAHDSLLSSCTQDGTDKASVAGVSSDEVCGGLVGSMTGSELYNGLVRGKVGSMAGAVIGGLAGEMSGGKLKVSRFEGVLGVSAAGLQPETGLFVGKLQNDVALGENLKYLFTDSEEKYYINPFGSRLNGMIREEHHIGVVYSNQSYSLYSPVSSPKFRIQEKYFYEELEEGVLEEKSRDLDHWAPGKNGEPVCGYLVTIPRIPNGTLSVMEAQNVYAREITSSSPGAIARGANVNVYTGPVHRENEEPPIYYELREDSLRWYAANDREAGGRIQTHGYGYGFTMPDSHIILDAVYQAMTNGVVLNHSELKFHITQIRTGSRFQPEISWETDLPVRILPTIIPDQVENKKVNWTVQAKDEAGIGSVSIDQQGLVSVNPKANWIASAVKEAEEEQQRRPQNRIPDETKECRAVVTAVTEAGGKKAQCDVRVIFQIQDFTYVPVTGITLDQETLTLSYTKTLTGNRKNPQAEYSIPLLPRLSVSIQPAFAENQTVSWGSDCPEILQVEDGRISLITGNDWEESIRAQGLREGERKVTVYVVSEDGGYQGNCEVTLKLVIKDKTKSNGGSGGGSSSGANSSGGSSSGNSSSGGHSSGVQSGIMASNPYLYQGIWQQEDLGWKLLKPDGTYASQQWAFLEGKWYYFNTQQEMVTGWNEIAGRWYYLWPNGSMATGWVWLNGSWYYLGQNGEMATGWISESEKWYYLQPDGTMAVDANTADGYYVDSTGAWQP